MSVRREDERQMMKLYCGKVENSSCKTAPARSTQTLMTNQPSKATVSVFKPIRKHQYLPLASTAHHSLINFHKEYLQRDYLTISVTSRIYLERPEETRTWVTTKLSFHISHQDRHGRGSGPKHAPCRGTEQCGPAKAVGGGMEHRGT